MEAKSYIQSDINRVKVWKYYGKAISKYYGTIKNSVSFFTHLGRCLWLHIRKLNIVYDVIFMKRKQKFCDYEYMFDRSL